MELNIIKTYVKGFMNHSGHSYDHVLRVYNICKKETKKMKNVNKKILFTSVLLHDIARSNESETGECHAKIGAKWAKEYLESINYKNEDIEKVVYCILNHRNSKGITPNTLEARILQQADRIDAIGAVGIIRTTVHNYKKIPYHSIDPLAKNRKIDDFTYGLDHFFFKILKLKDAITIPELKKEAQKRHELIINFLNKLEDEIKNKTSNEAILLINLIRDNHELKIYDIEKPFETKNTILSKIIEYEKLPFINYFLENIKSEIL